MPEELQLAPLRGRTRGGEAASTRPYAQVTTLRNGVGRAALVLGLASLTLSLMPGVGLVLAVGAVVTGIIGVRRGKRFEATNRRQAQLGLFLGSVAGVLAVGASIIVVVLWPQISDYRRCVADATTSSDHDVCSQQFRHAVDQRFP